MDKVKSTSSISTKNEVKTWEKSVQEDNITKKILVEEIENGFLVTVTKYGDVKDSKGNFTYINKSKKFFSETNPLDMEVDITQMAKDTAKALGVTSIFED